MSRRNRTAVWVIAGALALLGLGGWLAYRATQRVPAFYQQVAIAPDDIQKARGDELERRALELHNRTRHPGHWEIEITAAQVNGWLATDLPRKFPNLLPPEIRAPRVAIEPGRLLFACRHEGAPLSTVISLTVEVAMTEEPNVVALRIVAARAGLLPLPLKRVIDQLRSIAAQTGLPLRWAQQDGDPVALLTVIPEPGGKTHHRLVLESVRLLTNRVVISGRTERVK